MSQTKNLKAIKRMYKTRKPSLTRIAALAGISVSHLDNIISERREASQSLVDKILDAYQKAREEVKR